VVGADHPVLATADGGQKLWVCHHLPPMAAGEVVEVSRALNLSRVAGGIKYFLQLLLGHSARTLGPHQRLALFETLSKVMNMAVHRALLHD